MSDWKAVTDPNTGRIYYANLVTRETRWDPPPGFQDSNQQPITYSPDNQVNYQQQNNYQQNNYQQSFYGNQQNQYQQQQQQSFYQPQQQSFYGNQQNQYQQQQQQQSFYQQQQQPQQSFYQPQQQQQQQQQQQVDDSNSDWKAAFDDNTGKYYYYNEKTGQTQWHMPDELKQQQKTKKLPPTPNKQKPKQNSYQNQKQPQQYEQQINKLNKEKAEQAVKFGQQSVYNIQTGWDSSEDDEDEDDDNGDSWNDNSGNEEESSSGDDGLEQVVNGGKKKDQGQTHVITDPSSSESDMDQKNDNPFGNDEDEVLVEDDSDKYWTIGETQGQKYKMNDYADKYFQKDKHKKGLFKKQSVQEMLQWAPYSNVKHAFRKLDSKLNTQAKQTWKNICSYMGDRKSSKKSEGHIDKLLKYALKAPEELRDEIYIQIMKQTNKNPKKQSLMQGWRLLSIICSIFPPSDEFACYVAVYLFQQSKEAGDVGDCATFALKALDRTMAHGQRKMQPSPDEIQRIEHREPIHIKVWFLDRTFRVLLVTSQTKASQVEKALADAFRMRHPESFGLFEMEEPKPGWANEVYKKREQMDRQAKIDALQHLPFDRELEVNERIMDVMASWKRSKKKKDRKLRFVYKCKLFSKAQEGEYSRQGWKVAFITAVWHVRHELYPINEDHSFKLGALQLQATHGLKEQKDFYAPGVLIADVKDYVPYQLLNKYNDKQLESNILKYHNAYKHLDKPDAYRKYIEIIRGEACPTYFGLTFFRCVRVSRLRKQKTNEQEDLLIGIGETGVLFLHPNSLKVIERYKMEEILTYGFRSNAFLFVAGTLMTQRKYQFATMLGKQMNDLLRAHIDLRVQQAEVQGYNLMN